MDVIELENKFGAYTYIPLPVIINRGSGVYLWDLNNKKYLDMLSAYSAISHGHCHPRLVNVLHSQAEKVSLTSRAFYNDQLGKFLEKICQLTGMPKALPMNSGSEAVETAIKAARRWAYQIKGVPEYKVEIIACENNYHGRTITLTGLANKPNFKNFGPFPSGLKTIPYGNVEALRQAITPNTGAFLVEPIQGEGGIIIPPKGYLKACEQICRENRILLILDEIQTGLGRTGKLLACQHDHVNPDGITLGKALGGGIIPVSMFLAREEVMNVFSPGDHGSTFGGSPLAAAIGIEALNVLEEEHLIENAYHMGEYFITELKKIRSSLIKDVRGKGLLIGIEIAPQQKTARDICLELLENGLLSKETNQTVVRLAPPLIIKFEQVDEALSILKKVFT